MESRDDCVVMSLCDVNGSVVYATLSFSKGVVIWNNNMTSPRILANISRTSRGDVAHVRMFGESSYFTIEKSSSGKDTTLRISNDSCCHHIRAPCEIPSSQSHTRLIPLLLSSRGFHKTISSLMIFGMFSKCFRNVLEMFSLTLNQHEHTLQAQTKTSQTL